MENTCATLHSRRLYLEQAVAHSQTTFLQWLCITVYQDIMQSITLSCSSGEHKYQSASLFQRTTHLSLFQRMTGLLFTLLLLSADVQLNPGPVTIGVLQNFGADLCLCRWTWENKFDKETRYCCIRHNRPGFWTSRNKCVKYKKSSAPWKVPKLEMLLILTPSLLSQSWIFYLILLLI